MPAEFGVFLIACFLTMGLGAKAGQEFAVMKRHRLSRAEGSTVFYTPRDLMDESRYDETGNDHRVRGLRWLALTAVTLAAASVYVAF